MTEKAKKPGKRRVDQMLVDRGLVESRARAQALIMDGLVFAGETKVARVKTGEADGGAARREALNRAVDKLTSKFGDDAVQRGGALRGRGLGRDDAEPRSDPD